MKKFLLPLLAFVFTVSFTEIKAQSSPELCMVTVDAASTHNIIFWDKTGHEDADFFIIYREDYFSGSWDALDSIPRDSLSEYHDMNAQVNVRAQKYKISLVDTFGVESALSPYHKTVFCDEPSSGTFAWNWYKIEGQSNPTTEWVMLREDIAGSTGWVAIDTVVGSDVAFFDAQTAAFPLGQWRVRNLWPLSCTSTRTGVNTSRSNVRNQTMPPSGIEENELFQFTIYPNPANENIRLEGIFNNEKYIITDIAGKVVATGNLNSTNATLDISNYSQGMYIITIKNKSTKWLKN